MAFDSKRALNHAIKYLTESAHQRAAGGWIPPKEKERRKKEAAKSEEKQQKLLSKQFPTHYMPNVGRQVMQTGGVPEEQKESLQPTPQTVPQPTPQTAQPNQTYGLGQQLQRGTEMASRIPSSVNRLFVEPITTGISELMRPVYQGGDASSYQNPEMVGRAIDVVGGLGAGSMMIGPSAAQTNVLRSGMGPVAREVIAQPQRQLSPLGFYSAAAERASALQPSGDAAQMIAALKNTQGLKTEELMNAGLIDAAGNVHPEWVGRGKVTREDLVSHLQGQMPQVEETVLGGSGKLTDDQFARRYDEFYDQYVNEYGQPPRHDQLLREWANEQINPQFAEQQTKYQQYTLPGGENYREVLLKLPQVKNKPVEIGKFPARELFERNMMEKYGGNDFRSIYQKLNGNEIDKYDMLIRDERNTAKNESLLQNRRNNFQSPHWKDPNVLAHIRMADRTGPNGEKILHVEELQSDWGQKGKKEGFANLNAEKEYQAFVNDMRNRVREQSLNESINAGLEPERAKKLIDKIMPTMDADKLAGYLGERDKLNEAFSKYREASKGLPSAPYVTSTEGWTDLALKRVLKEAAEGGYDKVVWTPGAEQAKRYDLSKQISKLTLEDGPRGEQMLRAYGPSGDQVISRHITDAEKEIPDLVGKDVAQKLLSQEPLKPKIFRTDLSPSDIKVTPLDNRYKIESGEGWSSHVGNRVVGSADEAAEYAVKYFNQLAKEANDKVAIQGPYRALEGQELSVGGEGMKGYYDSIVPKRLQNLAKKYDKSARLGYAEVPDAGSLPALDITPAMRESILRGQSAYKRGGRVPPDLKMNVPIEGTKERMSNRRADVPVRWASSPDHPSAHLAYITDAEAELLKKADLHNSNIAHEHHVGPGGIPSYQGGGIGSGGSTNTSGGPGSAPGGDGSTSGSSGMGAGTGNISSSGGGGGGGGSSTPSTGGGGGSSSTSGGGGGGSPSMGIGLGSVDAFGSPSNMNTFGATDPSQEADTSMVDALSSNMRLGANLGSSLVQEAVTPDLSGGSDIMSPQNLGIQNGVLMGGVTPAAYGRMQSQPQMLQAMGIAGAPTTAADLSLAAQAARLGDIPGAAQAEAAPKPEAVNPITGATTPGGQALSETQWSNLGKPWAQAATDIANWIGAGFKTPEAPAPAPQPSVPFVKEQGAAPGSPSASITPQGTGLSGFEAALGTTPTATGQINVPNAGDLYAASNAPLAVNQQSAPSTSAPDLADIMGTKPQGEYLFSGMDIAQKAVPNTYSVDPNSVIQQVRKEWPNMTRAMNDQDIQNAILGGLPEGVAYKNGILTGNIYDPELQATLQKGGVSMQTFKPVTETAATTQWGQPQEGAYRSVSMDGVAPQTFGSMYPVSPMATQPMAPDQAPSTAPRVGMPQLSQQPIQTSNAQQPMTVRQNFDRAFAEARARGDQTFYWTNPATGERTLYTTQLARKEGGRVPSLSNPDDWVAKSSKVAAPSKKTSSRKPSKIDGTAIVRRALMLSSRKS